MRRQIPWRFYITGDQHPSADGFTPCGRHAVIPVEPLVFSVVSIVQYVKYLPSKKRIPIVNDLGGGYLCHPMLMDDHRSQQHRTPRSIGRV